MKRKVRASDKYRVEAIFRFPLFMLILSSWLSWARKSVVSKFPIKSVTLITLHNDLISASLHV